MRGDYLRRLKAGTEDRAVYHTLELTRRQGEALLALLRARGTLTPELAAVAEALRKVGFADPRPDAFRWVETLGRPTLLAADGRTVIGEIRSAGGRPLVVLHTRRGVTTEAGFSSPAAAIARVEEFARANNH